MSRGVSEPVKPKSSRLRDVPNPKLADFRMYAKSGNMRAFHASLCAIMPRWPSGVTDALMYARTGKYQITSFIYI